jgi:RNA polymerase sigma factor (sigma-70 family)
MANLRLHILVQRLRRASDDRRGADLTDGELVRRFRDARDEAAFAALLHRHGPLVLGVCHRILHDPHDAEDAFQATFLLLVRKAHTIVKLGSVASWLHGVAHRIAVRLKGDIARRRLRERQACRPPAPDQLQEVVWCDLRAMLDEEVQRLPARCREPFALCYLEGKTNAEAARLLGCPKGTVQSRLMHARELLRSALARRGLILSGSLLAAMLPQPTAAPAASAALIESTLRMALAPTGQAAVAAGATSAHVLMLAEGALGPTVLSKFKIAVGLLLLAGVLSAGVGGNGPGTSPVPAGAPAAAPARAGKADAPGPGESRKRLSDPDPQVRLKAALRLAEELDEQAINVLIELLAVLPAPQRRQAERALQQIAEEWSPTPALAGDDEISRRILRDAWAGWWRNADGQALLAAFRKRTLSKDQTARALARIAELDDDAFETRRRAAAEVVGMGSPVVPLLRQALPGRSLEQSRRIEQCIRQIAKAGDADALPVVAARLLALRKPAGATETLLAYVAFTDDEVMKAEVTKALHRLARTGVQPDASLVTALRDALPVRRALAGEVLAAVTDAEVRAAVHKLLADPDLSVRLRVAVALACAADRDAVPVLIDLLAELPADQAWQAEELLRTVAGSKAPSRGAADDVAARQKLRGAWRTWYAAHGAKLRLAPQPVPPPLLGFTTIAAMSFPPDRTKSRVLEVDRHGKVRWQFTCHYPVDVRVLPNNRVLVSEGEALRVTERDFKGNIHWQVDTPEMPYNIQRLPGGNTFVGTSTRLLEYDPTGKTVFDRTVEGGMVAAAKLPDGQIVYLTGTGKCVRLDGSGKPVKSFESGENSESGCVLDLTSRGGLLVSRCSQSMAEEFDLEGKSLWRTPGPVAPGIVTEVRNGHFMVAVFSQSAVVELDRSGKTVWRCETPGYNPFLARRR